MKNTIAFGADVVSLLLPHRRPFLMVDSVLSVRRSPRPSLVAARAISINEPVFEGHFPGLSLWPGVYTIEGMGQTCNLLRILERLEEIAEQAGFSPEELLPALRALDLGTRLRPGGRPPAKSPLLERLRAELIDPGERIGVSAAVDVKLLQPVFAGERLVYTVTQTHVIEDLVRFEVQAEVDGRLVARGVMSGAMSGLGPPGRS